MSLEVFDVCPNGPSTFQLYVYDLCVLVAQIFRVVFPHFAEPQILSRLCLNVLGLAIWVGKPEASVGQESSDARRMLMHDLLFAAAISRADHAHAVVL